jgi:hypothetical protein
MDISVTGGRRRPSMSVEALWRGLSSGRADPEERKVASLKERRS